MTQEEKPRPWSEKPFADEELEAALEHINEVPEDHDWDHCYLSDEIPRLVAEVATLREKVSAMQRQALAVADAQRETSK